MAPGSHKTASAAFAIALTAAALVAGGPTAQAIHDGKQSTTEDHPWVAAIEDENGSCSAAAPCCVGGSSSPPRTAS